MKRAPADETRGMRIALMCLLGVGAGPVPAAAIEGIDDTPGRPERPPGTATLAQELEYNRAMQQWKTTSMMQHQAAWMAGVAAYALTMIEGYVADDDRENATGQAQTETAPHAMWWRS